MRHSGFVERRMNRFLRGPTSIRYAARVIVVVTTAVVVLGAVLMTLLDHREFGSIWLGLWWSLQTVTTVGYGDVSPKAVSGRLVGALVMLEGIAVLSIVTAAITSTFIERARIERAKDEASDMQRAREALDSRFDDLERRLDRIATLIERPGGPPDPSARGDSSDSGDSAGIAAPDSLQSEVRQNTRGGRE